MWAGLINCLSFLSLEDTASTIYPSDSVFEPLSGGLNPCFQNAFFTYLWVSRVKLHIFLDLRVKLHILLDLMKLHISLDRRVKSLTFFQRRLSFYLRLHAIVHCEHESVQRHFHIKQSSFIPRTESLSQNRSCQGVSRTVRPIFDIV